MAGGTTGRRGEIGVDARASATSAGVAVAAAYWPCLLRWLRRDTSGRVLEDLRAAVRRWDPRSLVAGVARGSQLLLLADEPRASAPREELGAVVGQVVAAGRGGRPSGGSQAVIGDLIGPDDRLDPVVRGLCRAGAEPPLGRDVVVWARGEALRRLVELLDARSARQFVEDQVGRLAAYDRRHGTSLERVLELALDHDDRGTAAEAAFMHRNTFRRQLRKARELLGADLECPEERIAVHLALKMRARHNAPAAGRCGVHRAD